MNTTIAPVLTPLAARNIIRERLAAAGQDLTFRTLFSGDTIILIPTDRSIPIAAWILNEVGVVTEPNSIGTALYLKEINS